MRRGTLLIPEAHRSSNERQEIDSAGKGASKTGATEKGVTKTDAIKESPMADADIQAVLFDKDGTLLDFNATWVSVYRHAAGQVAQGDADLVQRLLVEGGLDPQTGRFAQDSALACETTPVIAALWAVVAGYSDVASLSKQLEQLFRTLEVRKLAPVAGLRAGLDQLAARGIRLGLATMDSEAMANADLKAMGVHGMFDFICGADSGFGTKPEPGMVRAFCRTLGIGPECVAIVGDTAHDLNMGRNAGVGLVVGVLTGAGTAQSLAPHADHIVPDVAGVAPLIWGAPDK